MAKFKVKVTELEPFKVTDSDPARGAGLGSDQCDNPTCDLCGTDTIEMASDRDPVVIAEQQELSPLSER